MAKIKKDQVQESIAKIRDSWQKLVPDKPFVFSFLDASLQEKYEAEQGLSQLSFVFSILAIVIACMGFWAVFSHDVKQRAKEISIRRVIGADFYQLLNALSRNLSWIFSLSFLFAIPVVWIFRQNWLSNYAYQSPFSIWPFLLALVLLGGVLSLIIVYRTLRAVSISPAQDLKD